MESDLFSTINYMQTSEFQKKVIIEYTLGFKSDP